MDFVLVNISDAEFIIFHDYANLVLNYFDLAFVVFSRVCSAHTILGFLLR